MKTKDLEEVIRNTFESITKLYNGQNHETHLIFPRYYDRNGKAGEKRVSEQELRQLFIEALNRLQPDWQYSVETPTRKKYSFPEDDEPKVCENDEGGVSARFDLTIWVHGKMAAIVEFKAGNARERDYKKDLCKLANPDEGETDTLRYFVTVLADSYEKTFGNINDKFEKCKKGKETIHLWLLSMGIHQHGNRGIKEYNY